MILFPRTDPEEKENKCEEDFEEEDFEEVRMVGVVLLLLFVVAFNVACFVATRDDDVLLLRAKLFRPLFFNKASFENEQPFLALVFKDKEREA